MLSPVSIRSLLLSISLFLLVCFFLLPSSFLPSQQNPPYNHKIDPTQKHESPFIPTCDKITPSLSKTLIHYATSNTTPQQTLLEVSVTARVLEKRSPCNFLVFGLGHDSPMWAALNHGGRTVFLEEDEAWIEQIGRRHPDLESFHVRYQTKVLLGIWQ